MHELLLLTVKKKPRRFLCCCKLQSIDNRKKLVWRLIDIIVNIMDKLVVLCIEQARQHDLIEYSMT